VLDQVMFQDEGVRALRWVARGTLSKPLLLVGPGDVLLWVQDRLVRVP
jgi:hypothetical protein